MTLALSCIVCQETNSSSMKWHHYYLSKVTSFKKDWVTLLKMESKEEKVAQVLLSSY